MLRVRCTRIGSSLKVTCAMVGATVFFTGGGPAPMSAHGPYPDPFPHAVRPFLQFNKDILKFPWQGGVRRLGLLSTIPYNLSVLFNWRPPFSPWWRHHGHPEPHPHHHHIPPYVPPAPPVPPPPHVPPHIPPYVPPFVPPFVPPVPPQWGGSSTGEPEVTEPQKRKHSHHGTVYEMPYHPTPEGFHGGAGHWQRPGYHALGK